MRRIAGLPGYRLVKGRREKSGFRPLVGFLGVRIILQTDERLLFARKGGSRRRDDRSLRLFAGLLGLRIVSETDVRRLIACNGGRGRKNGCRLQRLKRLLAGIVFRRKTDGRGLRCLAGYFCVRLIVYADGGIFLSRNGCSRKRQTTSERSLKTISTARPRGLQGLAVLIVFRLLAEVVWRWILGRNGDSRRRYSLHLRRLVGLLDYGLLAEGDGRWILTRNGGGRLRYGRRLRRLEGIFGKSLVGRRRDSHGFRRPAGFLDGFLDGSFIDLAKGRRCFPRNRRSRRRKGNEGGRKRQLYMMFLASKICVVWGLY